MADTELWKACLGEKEVRAMTRDIHARQDSSDIYGVELRITRNGELYLSEVFRDRRKTARAEHQNCSPKSYR